jgi:acetyl-CoA carboxylase carboxyltransferase component
MATGFIRLNGATVGVVANRAASFDEKGEVKASYDTVLTTKGLTKAARFVKFCDAFELPVLTVTNVTGFAASKDEESTIAQAAASFVAALSETTSPKVNIILNAIGSAYAVMNSKAIGADITIALPDAKIGVIDARHAADILAAGKSADEKAAVEKEYDTLQNASASAAARGYVDEIADPADLRKYVIGAFEMLYTKREEVLSKKHGTV